MDGSASKSHRFSFMYNSLGKVILENAEEPRNITVWTILVSRNCAIANKTLVVHWTIFTSLLQLIANLRFHIPRLSSHHAALPANAMQPLYGTWATNTNFEISNLKRRILFSTGYTFLCQTLWSQNDWSHTIIIVSKGGEFAILWW